MSTVSKIQWTDATWNIARGCTKVDEDCKYCYMYRESMNGTRYEPKEIVRTKTVFDLPLKLKEPSKIFTCSLTDFFHESIDSYRNEAWDIIRKCPQHIFQILTKRPERILECLPTDWGEGWNNVWLGTSCGSGAEKAMQRMTDLIQVRNSVNVKCLFLSLEPLHGPVEIPIDCNDGMGFFEWIIVGGESGNDTGKYRYRPCDLEWIENIVNAARRSGSAVFVKQMGTYLAKELKMTDRHGGNIDEFPLHLQVRQFPNL